MIKKLYLAFIFFVMYAPIFYLIFYAFNSGDSMNSFEGFSWTHFSELFADTRMLVILLETFILAFASAAVATVIGTFGALYITNLRSRLANTAFMSLNNILLVSPDVLIGASFILLFTFIGLQLGVLSVFLSHVAFSIPIVVLMVLPKIHELSKSQIDAARDLGANSFQTMTQVILPFLTPGIIAGYFMAFTYSLDDFAVTFFTTGNGFTTLSVEIYSRARRGVSLEINALSALVFLFACILVVGYYLITREKSAKEAR
ncbi:MAG: ABC transporter permease [Lactobacillales bacterium]|jgi:spermidine/putrescine transport system permease protein|nr:ABC transporter permease [Lactobacillales bacterium]